MWGRTSTPPLSVEPGNERLRRRSFATRTRSGFDELDAWLQRQGQVDRVVVESSGHYWWPLASHLRQRGVPLAVVNPLEAKYFAKSRLQRSKSDPADARTLAALGMRDQPPAREPLLGAEVREAARFCMRLVRDQANVCQRLLRLVEIGFPELKEAFEDPTWTRLARPTPTARRPPAEHAGPGHQARRPSGGWSRAGQPRP